jgi:hypothetical protein
MPKPLDEMILEEEIRRLERELRKLEGDFDYPRPIEECEVLAPYESHDGPEYMEVLSKFWEHKIIAEGHIFNCLQKVRDYAHSRGFKGIRVVFGTRTA